MKSRHITGAEVANQVVFVGHPILRQTSLPVKQEDFSSFEFKNLIERMRALMTNTDSAVGIAAPQLGVPWQVCAVQYKMKWISEYEKEENIQRDIREFPLTFLINPSIIKLAGKKTRQSRKHQLSPESILDFESCLSIPGYNALVPRQKSVQIRSLDETGKCIDQRF